MLSLIKKLRTIHYLRKIKLLHCLNCYEIGDKRKILKIKLKDKNKLTYCIFCCSLFNRIVYKYQTKPLLFQMSIIPRYLRKYEFSTKNKYPRLTKILKLIKKHRIFILITISKLILQIFGIYFIYTGYIKSIYSIFFILTL